jgi:hypothetical protein
MKRLFTGLISGCLATVSLPLLVSNAQAESNWDWTNEAKWFEAIGCREGIPFACLTNEKQSIEVRPRDIHTGVVITAMAAGHDTTAHLYIRRRKCTIKWNLKRDCKYIDEYSETFSPRTYRTFSLKGRHDRIIKLTPISGESRVHLAVRYIPEQTNTAGSFYFCVSSNSQTWQTFKFTGRNLAEARSNADRFFSPFYYIVLNGACVDK